MQKPERPLTRKQKRFVREYMVDLNATQAAIRAGYREQNADKIGPELLGKTRTQLDQALRDLAQRTNMNAYEVVDRLQLIANTDITDFLTWKGNELTVKDPKEIPSELRQCIESITQHETQHVKYLKVKLHSKVPALGMLAKYHNLFKRTIASKGLNVHIHVAAGPQAQRAPIPTENGHKPDNPQKVAFALAQERRTDTDATPSMGGNQWPINNTLCIQCRTSGCSCR